VHHTARLVQDVAFITVQYNNPADTRIFLKSLGRLRSRSRCDVIVVDNSDRTSDNQSHEALSDLAVEVLRPPTNLYYWGGAAHALESFYGSSGPWPKWVVICNNDIEVLDEDFLETLGRLDPASHPIVAPAILSGATGKDQNPLLEVYPGRLKRMKWRLYDVAYPIARSLLAIHAIGVAFVASGATRSDRTLSPGLPRRIYAPHGACMIFSSTFFEKGGKLDTHVPLFAEELTIAALAQKLGLAVWYRPEIRIAHREHSTIGHELTRKKYEMERRARRRFYNYDG
jgi:GT2 family glycosyltransferase